MTEPPNAPPNSVPDSLAGNRPDGLPDTASPKEPVRWWLAILAVLLGTLVLALFLVNAWRTWGFPPGGESNGAGVESVVVSAEKSRYLPADVERFGGRPGVVYVYVVVRRMPSGERLRVRVERESADSVLDRIFPKEEGEVVIEPLETRPGPGENLDAARFVLSGGSGTALSPGRYTISVYREPETEGGEGPAARPAARLAARKFFQIQG